MIIHIFYKWTIYLNPNMRLDFDSFVAWLRVLIHFVLNCLGCRLIISTYQYHGLSKSAAEMKIICVNDKFKKMVCTKCIIPQNYCYLNIY